MNVRKRLPQRLNELGPILSKGLNYGQVVRIYVFGSRFRELIERSVSMDTKNEGIGANIPTQGEKMVISRGDLFGGTQAMIEMKYRVCETIQLLIVPISMNSVKNC